MGNIFANVYSGKEITFSISKMSRWKVPSCHGMIQQDHLSFTGSKPIRTLDLRLRRDWGTGVKRPRSHHRLNTRLLRCCRIGFAAPCWFTRHHEPQWNASILGSGWSPDQRNTAAANAHADSGKACCLFWIPLLCPLRSFTLVSSC